MSFRSYLFVFFGHSKLLFEVGITFGSKRAFLPEISGSAKVLFSLNKVKGKCNKLMSNLQL